MKSNEPPPTELPPGDEDEDVEDDAPPPAPAPLAPDPGVERTGGRSPHAGPTPDPSRVDGGERGVDGPLPVEWVTTLELELGSIPEGAEGDDDDDSSRRPPSSDLLLLLVAALGGLNPRLPAVLPSDLAPSPPDPTVGVNVCPAELSSETWARPPDPRGLADEAVMPLHLP